MQTTKHGLFVVCASAFSADSKPTSESVALVAVGAKSNHLWSLTCGQLDSETNRFDLTNMAFDGKQIFVLNNCKPKSILYAVSLDGRKACKVRIGGRAIAGNYYIMAVDRNRGWLLLVDRQTNDTVEAFKLIPFQNEF